MCRAARDGAKDLVVVARLADRALAPDQLQRLLEQWLVLGQDPALENLAERCLPGPDLVLRSSAQDSISQQLLRGTRRAGREQSRVAIVERLQKRTVAGAAEHRPIALQEMLHHRQRAAADHKGDRDT